MTDTELDELLDTWQAPVPPRSLRAGLDASFPARKPRRVFGGPLRWAIVVGAIGAAFLALGGSFVAGPEISHFAAGLDNGRWMTTTRIVDPPISQLKAWMRGSGLGTGRGYWWDHLSRTYSGYRLRHEALTDGSYRVSVEPLSSAELLGIIPAISPQWHFVALPSIPEPRIIKPGEAYEIELSVDPGGGRMYDRVIFSQQMPDWARRMFDRFEHRSPEEEASTLRLANPTLLINGRVEPGPLGVRSRDGYGPTMWFYIPHEGRFLVALDSQSNPLFEKAGWVDGNALEFTLEGNQYRIETSEPITTGGRRDIYVFHQTSFEPRMLNPANGAASGVMFGSAGTAGMYRW